jgi:hypothetical protein
MSPGVVNTTILFPISTNRSGDFLSRRSLELDGVVGESPGRIADDFDVLVIVRAHVLGIPSRDFAQVIGMNAGKKTALKNLVILFHKLSLQAYSAEGA